MYKTEKMSLAQKLRLFIELSTRLLIASYKCESPIRTWWFHTKNMLRDMKDWSQRPKGLYPQDANDTNQQD